MRHEFVCLQCNIIKTVNVSPSILKKGPRQYCSRSCQMKANFKGSSAGIKQFTCLHCGVCFSRYVKSNGIAQYCSRSCSSKHYASSGLNACSTYDQMIDAGRHDLIVKVKTAKSQSTRQRNLGKKLSSETREKISKSCKGIVNVLKGKTYIEFYGEARSSELSRQHSERLKEGYRSGRIKPTVRTKYAPSYFGIKLRSKLELKMIMFLEERDNLKFGQTLLYEDERTFTDWIDDSGVKHVYVPDLYDIINNIVYEVKPEWKVLNESREMFLKRCAIERNDKFTFSYLSEKELL